MKYELYCPENWRCYANKFGIIDETKLEQAERIIVQERKNAILDGSHFIDDTYDINMMKEIHSYLFSDLYDWAGYVRSEPDEMMSYKSVLFTRPTSIEDELNEVFEDIKKTDFLRGADVPTLAEKSSEYFCRFNKIHPFFEGNGRVQKLIISDLLFKNDCLFDLSKIDPSKIYDANMAGLKGNYKPLADLYRGAIIRVDDVR